MSDNEINSDKKYNTRMMPLYEMSNGYWSLPIDDFAFKQFQAAVAEVGPGARLIVARRREDTRKKASDCQAFLEVMSAERAAEWDRTSNNNRAKKGL